MKKKVKGLCLILAFVLLLTSTFGCGSKNENTEIANDEFSGDGLTQDTTYKANFDGKTIVLSCWVDLKRELGKNELEDASYFAMEYAKKKHNAKIEYKMVTSAEYTEQFTQAALSNSVFADIVTVHSDNHALWVNQGYLNDVTEYIKNEDPNKWDLQLSLFKGKYYGINALGSKPYPWQGMTYNTNVLKELNLESPQELDKKNEWNWQKFREYCKVAVKDSNSDGKTDRYGMGIFGFVSALRYSNNAVPYVEDNGKFYNANTFPQTRQKFLVTLDFLRIMTTEDKSILGSVAGGMGSKMESEEAFKANELLFTFGGPLTWKDFKKQNLDFYAPVYYPKGPSGDERVDYVDGYSFFGFPKNSSYNLKDLVAFWKDANITWDQSRGKAYYESSEENELQRLWTEQFVTKEDAEYVVQASKNMRRVSLYNGSLRYGGIEIFDIYQKIINGESTPAATVAATDGPIQAKIDEVLNS